MTQIHNTLNASSESLDGYITIIIIILRMTADLRSGLILFKIRFFHKQNKFYILTIIIELKFTDKLCETTVSRKSIIW